MFRVFVVDMADLFRKRHAVIRWDDGAVSVISESDTDVEGGSCYISAEHIGEVISLLPKHRAFMNPGDEIVVLPMN